MGIDKVGINPAGIYESPGALLIETFSTGVQTVL